uniref:C-type_lectin_beta-subunit n=1 Tax=Ovophis okinavensis TaxID=8769 RepID=U3TBV1_OVOOK|nr:c-type_lectin_beta-subunit [Ovophis okinavensis]
MSGINAGWNGAMAPSLTTMPGVKNLSVLYAIQILITNGGVDTAACITVSSASSRHSLKIQLSEVWRSKEAPHPHTPHPACCNLCPAPFAQRMLSVAGSGFAAPDGPEGPINSA